MTKQTYVVAGALLLFGLVPTLQGCSPADEAAAPGAATPPAESPVADQAESADQGVTIEFGSEADPPTPGENTFEAVVTQADGSPVTDATVEAVFSMPAMPAMNMPEMSSTAPLTHEGAGIYRGSGFLSMNGSWNVIVTATRGTEEIGRASLTMVAE